MKPEQWSSRDDVRLSPEARAVLLATVATTGHFLAVYMIQPLISLYAAELGSSPMLVGFAVSSFGLLPMFLAVPAGMLMDRTDVRQVVRTGAVVSIVAIAMLTAVAHYSSILVAQLLLGASHSILLLATQNYVGAVSSPRTRPANFSYFGTGTALGMTVAPAIGGGIVALVTAVGGGMLPAIAWHSSWPDSGCL